MDFFATDESFLVEYCFVFADDLPALYGLFLFMVGLVGRFPTAGVVVFVGVAIVVYCLLVSGCLLVVVWKWCGSLISRQNLCHVQSNRNVTAMSSKNMK